MEFETASILLHGNKEYLLVTGRVKSWDPFRGWGYITPDDGSADVFVFRSDITFKTKTATTGKMKKICAKVRL